MRSMRSLLLLALISLTSALSATATSPAVAPSVRIVNAIDENSLVTLKGNTHPFANARNDRGRVRPDLPMTDLILVLSRSPEQQVAFDKFVAALYDPESPSFHHWLSPEEVGAAFGPSPVDIASISSWLARGGFSVTEVAPNRMSIRFGGTAEQVESAFHTEIHNLEVKGEAHIGNMSDPQIPAALAPVVAGVKSLHNFFPRPQHHLGAKVTRDPATGKWRRVAASPAEPTANRSTRSSAVKPQFGISVPASGGSNAYLLEDVSPYDFATIYNVLPLWNASTPIDGTGQTIAIAGTSNICLGQTDSACLYNGSYNNDIATFRSTFGLPAYTVSNQPTAVSGNSQPLKVCSNSTAACGINDLIENSLDVEWAGAVAPGAKIVLVSSYPASSSDDALYDSENYIVSHKTASIMNVSYGVCELYAGTAGNLEYYNLWQTAYAEGIAVFVASGDGGAAACDDGASTSAGNPYSAQMGLSVNGLASTPFNVAVGGTDFNWCSLTSTTECTPAPYWKSSNTANGSSAIGYVPEVPWNDTCANPLTVGFLEAWATSSYAGGVGGVTDPESGCNFVYNHYSTVDANAGVTLEYIVDTYGSGGGASGCVVNDGLNVSSCAASTTSTGSGNGNIPLVNDGWPKPGWQTGVSGIPSDGVRDLPDVSFFASDGYLSSSAYLICVSANSSTNAPCSYSTSSLPVGQEVGGTSVSSPAMAGVMALINQKAGAAQGNPNAELYALAAKQTYASCSAETVTNSSACLFNDIDQGNNAVPCDNGADEGGVSGSGIVSPNCTVNNSADLIGILSGYNTAVGYDQATGLGSLNVANVVNAWPVIAGTASATVAVSPASSTFASSASLSVAVTVVAVTSGGATPTGTVTLTGGGYSSAVETLASGSYSFTVPPNSLTPGNDTLTVTYSGDSNYGSTIGTASVTVTGALPTPNVTVIPSAPSISSSTALNVAVMVASPTSGGTTPTGTVTLSGGGYTSTAGSLSGGIYTFTVPANSLSAGTDTLTVTYSGDSNYATTTGTASVTVTASLAAATVTVTPAQSTLTVNSSLSVGATVAPTSGSGATPTGTVILTGGGYTSSAQTLASGAYTFTIPANSLNAGTDTLTVTYSGDLNYASNTGTASVTVTLAAATVTVSPAQSSITAGTALSVPVTVASTSGSGATPTGTVTLTGGGYTSSAQTLTSGAYTFTIPANSLNAGTDTLTVTYSGDLNYASNTGTASVTVTAANATFTLSATTPASVNRGTPASSTITVTATNGYVGTASLTCALTTSPGSAVDPPSCSLSPTSVTLTSSTTSGAVTATVTTTAATAQLVRPDLPGKDWVSAGGGAVLAFLVFLGIPARRRSWRSMLGVLLLMAAFAGLSGCGDFWKAPSGNSSAGTTSGTYTFTVTGTGNPTVTAVTTTFQVTVN